MQLTDGICEFLGRENAALPGDMPEDVWPVLFSAWLADLEFVAVPAYQTEKREDRQADRRIRVLWDGAIREAKAALVCGEQYKITRVYVGKDDESGERIMDISLQRWDEGGEAQDIIALY